MKSALAIVALAGVVAAGGKYPGMPECYVSLMTMSPRAAYPWGNRLVLTRFALALAM